MKTKQLGLFGDPETEEGAYGPPVPAVPAPPPAPDPEPVAARPLEPLAPLGGECHWPDCEAECRPTTWACDRHWAVLPVPIRESISRTWDAAKEADGIFTVEHVAACRGAYGWIELNEGDLREDGVL